MKRYLLILLLTLPLCLWAQRTATPQGTNTRNQQQQLMELTNYYLREFQLQGVEGAEFTRLFYAYNKELHTLMRQYATPQQSSDEDQQETLILERFRRQRAILDVREKYYHLLRKVLSPTQIQKIYDDEKARKARLQP